MSDWEPPAWLEQAFDDLDAEHGRTVDDCPEKTDAYMRAEAALWRRAGVDALADLIDEIVDRG